MAAQPAIEASALATPAVDPVWPKIQPLCPHPSWGSSPAAKAGLIIPLPILSGETAALLIPPVFPAWMF